MNLHQPPLRDALAAEYVLGALQGAARRRFESLLPAHPALRKAVTEWERRLNRLAVASPSITPPPEVWRGLEQRLFPAEPRRSWWNSLALWRGLALASLLAAVVTLAPQLAVLPSAGDLPFAAIRDPNHDVLWTVAMAEDGRLHVNSLRAMDIPADQHCLLWVKRGDDPPLMLGELPDQGDARTLSLPADMPRPTQSVLWVSMQPRSDDAPPAQPLYRTRWQTL
jgi:anti-sigma-K factor RskA